MRLPEETSKRSLVSLTPLIDVVFILLIFFMLASSFLKWEHIELGLKETVSVVSDKPESTLIQIDDDGDYRLNGKAADLKTIAKHVERAVATGGEHAIVLEPKEGVVLQSVMIVMDAVRSAGGRNVSLGKR
ncbi:MAG TPA: biopolymer transporter ExbD [Gammaproteobacteria bacterium]